MNKTPLKKRLARIIFEADTPLARAFDTVLLLVIVISIILVVLETIDPVRQVYGQQLYLIEWVITILFTIEYLLRLFLARHAFHYARSFYGIVDLLAIIPTYISLIFPDPHYLIIIRGLRLLRLFRIFKLTRHIRAAENIKRALIASKAKITVFLGSTLFLMMIIGALMYLIEGPENGFENIPISIYWAINTMTPVSESDLIAKTPLGQVFAAILMIMGYALLAIPSGIVSSEITRASIHQRNQRACPSCKRTGHENQAEFCKYCGAKLNSSNLKYNE